MENIANYGMECMQNYSNPNESYTNLNVSHLSLQEHLRIWETFSNT